MSADTIKALTQSLPSLLEYNENLTDSDESEDEEEEEQSRKFAVKRDSCFKQNVKVNADAQLDQVPEDMQESMDEFRKNSSNRYVGVIGRVQIPAYKDGTMTVMEPSLMKLLKSNMKSTKDEHAEMLRDLLCIGRQSL